jgi:hypothetical protein
LRASAQIRAPVIFYRRLANRSALVLEHSPMFRRHWLWAILGLALTGSAGCAHKPPVQPWQREYLSKRALRFDGDLQEDRFRQHLFGAREGADLGYGQPGGGCGCN